MEKIKFQFVELLHCTQCRGGYHPPVHHRHGKCYHFYENAYEIATLLAANSRPYIGLCNYETER